MAVADEPFGLFQAFEAKQSREVALCFAGCLVPSTARWRSMVVYRSDDGGVSYAADSAIDHQATMGQAESALPDGYPGLWDRSSTVDVRLYYGSLSSTTEALVLAGANRAWLNGETLAFANAELVSPSVYRLSTLLRGIEDSQLATGGHVYGDPFVLLDDAVACSERSMRDVGRTLYWKGVSGVRAEGDKLDYSVRTLRGWSRMPWSPYDIRGTRDSSDNLTLTWKRRSRLRTQLLQGHRTPLAESAEEYEVDVLDGADVVRTIEATSPTASYSAAQQTSDGLTPGDPVSVRVYQISQEIGRGHYREATV